MTAITISSPTQLGHTRGSTQVQRGGGPPPPAPSGATASSTAAQAKLDAAAAELKLEADAAELRLEAAAAALKLSASTLVEHLKAGNSLKDIATSQGVDFVKVQTAMSDPITGATYSADGISAIPLTGPVVNSIA